jgi:chorismate synthase
VISGRALAVGGEFEERAIEEKISSAIAAKDTVGGLVEVTAQAVPPGLGSYVQPDRRLDARLAASVMSIPGIKAMEIGLGFGYAEQFGSQVHDAIYYKRGRGYFRRSNNAGGIEGGVSNGEDIIIRACMKPISTLMEPLPSVNISSRKAGKASTERSDTCVVQAAAVVAEAGVAYVLADALLEKFGGDSLLDIKKAYQAYLRRIR